MLSSTEARAPLRGPQLLPSDTAKYSFQGRWNSKAGSLITQDAVFLGLAGDEVMKFNGDLQKMVPNEFHQKIHFNQTRSEQGNWPTKTIVNMWFKNETNLATMIGLLKIVENG